MLDPDQISRIRSEINGQIEQLEEQILSLKEQCKPVQPDSSLGRITRMDAIQQKSMAEENLRQSESTLHSLKDTLDRLNDAGFGICTVCKQNIAPERILYLPQAKTCVHCAR
ncbi:MAG: TraR/DksA C4-type zinc finger protein [Candidatus Omnitrophica bacterium]|nr:TraR/DksA C4-type zinc finger protein [Candidatus Omnitrophota bacterium]